jgi:HlyD family secretion protein
VTSYVTAAVARQTVVQTIGGTGQVANTNKLDIKPQNSNTQNSNTIIKLLVQPSQQVKAGDIIAVIDQSDALLALQQARASVASAQANYDNIIAGATSEDIQLAKNSVASAEINLTNAQNNLQTVTAQQKTLVDNAHRNLLNSGLTAQQIVGPFSSPNVTAADAPTISGTYIGAAEGMYTITQQGSYFSVSGLETIASQKIDTRTPIALGTKGLFVQFPNDQISATWQINLPNVQANSYASNYNAYQTALQNQQSTLTSAGTQIESSKIAVSNAQIALQIKQKAALPTQVASARAQLINAQVQQNSAYTNYTKTTIRAPFDGLISSVTSKVGDQVTSATVIATLITNQQVVNVSLNETDVALISVGQPATLTFDALPDLVLTGKVTQIDTIGTVTQGVVYYNVQIALETQESKVKPSMSAQAAIIVNTASDVLAVPSGAVKTQGTQSYVQVVSSTDSAATDASGQVTLKSGPARQTVTVGISSDSLTEIKSGLTEGQTVVVRTITSSKTATSAATGASAVRIPGITGGGGAGGGFRPGN